jgi:hypothetical protein
MGRPRKKTSDILVAKDSGVLNLDGEEILIRRGVTRVRAGHKLAETYPDLFEPLKLHYDIEQATAAPGERRGA